MGSGNKPVVLLVDDRPEGKKIFSQIAEEFPFDLLVAEDGQEGFDLAREHEPDLIVIRKNVPILNAQSVSVLLKQSPNTEKIPILVICPDYSPDDEEKFQDAGCNDCIKDLDEVDIVISKLKEWLAL
ncbi:MAG: response regulator [Thermodesulfobacteria bacterium]|nr:response regulator [Thermodesulfobacteriota bacterium]